MMRWLIPPSLHFLAFLVFLISSGPLEAFLENQLSETTSSEIQSFLNSGERFTFLSADGKMHLQGIRFQHPEAKGMIVIVNGSTESWLKYGELFLDLYHHGYSLVSYDHRGQGLSPHLLQSNPQIGHIDVFSLYADDLNALVQHVILPSNHGKLYLLAHSMGGAVSIDYLERFHSPFTAVALSAPLIRINTSPYPESVTRLLITLLNAAGMGAHYAPGKHDHDPAEPFEGNPITSSRKRWEAGQLVWKNHPDAVLGGPSINWVDQAMARTALFRKNLPKIKERILILQAGKDQFVMCPDQDMASKAIPEATLVRFPDAKHEILMESDPIREKAIQAILNFFKN
jgi:lysophospholipase